MIDGYWFGSQYDSLGNYSPLGEFAGRVLNLDPDDDGEPNEDLRIKLPRARPSFRSPVRKNTKT